VRGLTDEQARRRTTVSELTLGAVIKHVTHCERGWVDFIERGTVAMEATEDNWNAHRDSFTFRDDETLAGLVDEYAQVAKHTDALVESLPSLDLAHRLPEAPWFPTGATRSARRVLTHIVAETAQHAGTPTSCARPSTARGRWPERLAPPVRAQRCSTRLRTHEHRRGPCC
jgi:uncharacterized damage-inducible protein DinB